MTKRVADERKLKRAFEVQADHCVKLEAPFNARVCGLLPDILDDTSALGRRVLGWSQDALGGDLVPLRCCAGFHALVRKNRVAALVEAYPPNTPDDAALSAALRDAIAQEDAYLAGYLDSAPQTNEIGRSGVLLGGLLAIAQRLRKPIALLEIGASAGLNLQFDRWSYDLGDAGRWGPEDARVKVRCSWTGDAPAVRATLDVVSRAASDLAPLDPAKPDHRDRLLSYIWPDQTERLERTVAALDLAAEGGLKVEKADAIDWVAERMSANDARPGTTTVLWHSVFIQYVEAPARRTLIDAIRSRGEQATDDRPFAWLEMEQGHQNRAQCELRLTLWPGGETVKLADVDWHGRSAHWL